MKRGQFKDLSNQQFGHLTAMWPAGRQLYGANKTEVVYLCACECGGYVLVATSNIRNQKGCSRSCPCTPSPIVHGHTRKRKYSPTYVSFHGAKQRCRDPKHDNYHKYGARGIEFRFPSFKAFFAEVGERPEGKTIDRINPNGHYEAGNVRWATDKEQRHNRREGGRR